jgi:hypothetical protein
MSEFVKYPRINGLYQHYKGGTYQVITMATHTETKENLVICKSVLFGSIYARPIGTFFELVKTADGNSVQRFRDIV